MPADVIYTGGPKGADGKRWCMVCAYTFKGAVNERFGNMIKAAQELPDGSAPVEIQMDRVDGLPPLFEAVALGLFGPLAQFGPLELCWSHLNAIQLRSASGLHLPAPGMDGGLGGFPGGGLNGR